MAIKELSSLVIVCNSTFGVGGEIIFASELATELEKTAEIHSTFLIRDELKGAKLVHDPEHFEPRLPSVKNPILLVLNLFLFTIFAVPTALTFIKRQRNKKQITIIHSHDGTFAGIVGIIVSKLSNTPILITFHGTHILSAYYIFNHFSHIASKVAIRLSNYCIENADHLIAVDPRTRDSIYSAIKTDRNIEIVPTFCRKMSANTPITRKSEIPNLPANSKLIGYIGRLSPEKNVLSLVEAFRMISETNPNVYLVIAGDGVLKEKITQCVKDMEIQDKVFLLGYVLDVEAIFKKLACLVLPSMSEGFPQVILEAWSCDVPVVASNRVIFLKNEKNALTFPPTDIGRQKEALLRITSDAELARMITENARKTLYSFSRENVTKKYASIILARNE